MNLALILYPCPEQVRQKLADAARGSLEVRYADPENLQSLLPQAEFIVGEPTMAQVQAAKKLQVLQMTWAGTDRYTRAPGFPEGVTLCNASGAFGVTIAEHAFAMLLSLCRRLPDYQRQQTIGRWQDCGSELALANTTALILGTGDLGSEVAKRCRAFGMRTVGFCRSKRVIEHFDEVYSTHELSDHLHRARALFGCIPDTPQTRNLLNRQTLALLPEDSVVINVGRGTLIDTDALYDCLRSGRLYGAGLDVTAPEPLPADHPLWKLPNVILTPHVAGVGFGHLAATEDAVWRIAEDNLRRHCQNQPLRNVIDISTGTRRR